MSPPAAGDDLGRGARRAVGTRPADADAGCGRGRRPGGLRRGRRGRLARGHRRAGATATRVRRRLGRLGGGCGDGRGRRRGCDPGRGWRARARAPGAGSGAAARRTNSCNAPIQMVLGDVLDDTVGNQVPDGESPSHPAAAIGRRYRQCGNFEQAYVALGNPLTLRSCPGRDTATKCARSQSSCTSFQSRICATASAPVMKKSSASGRWSRMSRRVSIVYVGALAVDVDAADREHRVRRRRDDRHQVAVLGLGDTSDFMYG